MSEYTPEKDALLMMIAETLAAGSFTLDDSMRVHLHLERMKSAAEPKPSAGISVKEPDAIPSWLLTNTIEALSSEHAKKNIFMALCGLPMAANQVDVMLRAPVIVAVQLQTISDLTRQIASRDEVAAGLHEEIDRLRAELERARTALKEIAEEGDKETMGGNYRGKLYSLDGHRHCCDRARTALETAAREG